MVVQLWIVLGAHVGVSCSWFAVQGVSRAAALEALGLVEAGPVRGDFPARDGLTDLPNGWLLLWFEDLGRAFAPDVVALSAQGRAVACSIEEHVMEDEVSFTELKRTKPAQAEGRPGFFARLFGRG
jgi:hypothetical protein